MKKHFFLTLLVFLGFTAYTQQLTVAVSTFDAKGGLSKDEAEAVTELFIGELVKNRTVKVVDRNNFDKILAEMRFQESDWADSKRVAQLGRALNAYGIIRGTVMAIGGQIVISSTLLDINTAEILSSSRLQMRRIDEVFDKLPTFVDEIVKNLPGASAKTGNASASAYYGVWFASETNSRFIIDENKFTWRQHDEWYAVTINCTWTADNNNDIKTLSEYPKGFKVTGVVVDYKGHPSSVATSAHYSTFWLFMHKNDKNKIYIYGKPIDNREIQNNIGTHYVKIQ